MADFDIAPEPSDPLTFRNIKEELLSISSSEPFASKRTATTKPTAHTSTAPNRRIEPHDMVFQSTRRAQDLPKGSPVQLQLSSPTASKPMKRTVSFDDRERSTSPDVWTPISSSQNASPTDWYVAWPPRRYPSHVYKRLKMTRPAEEILELQEQEKEWERGIKEREERMDKLVNQEIELEEWTSEIDDERDWLENLNKGQAEAMKQRMLEELERLERFKERKKERERRRDGREGGVLQQQRCEDDGDPNDTQERETQAQECVNQAPEQTTQEQSQQQQQGQGQARPQEEVHVPDTVSHTTTQPTSSSSAAPPPQGIMDVQKLVAVSLDKELMSRVRKVTVTTVVYELDPASNTDA
ncbi:hypothetical protein SLS55_002302 [Diplodia seriata]|uniref:Uncharacterized protein n=1 Tax=Diplodia seriata TaxID=420778 RepID=A0ABR3CRT6_9PEZI